MILCTKRDGHVLCTCCYFLVGLVYFLFFVCKHGLLLMYMGPWPIDGVSNGVVWMKGWPIGFAVSNSHYTT